jgi:hypothetical protein
MRQNSMISVKPTRRSFVSAFFVSLAVYPLLAATNGLMHLDLSPMQLAVVVIVWALVLLFAWPVSLLSSLEIYSWIIWPVMFAAVYVNTLLLFSLVLTVVSYFRKRHANATK